VAAARAVNSRRVRAQDAAKRKNGGTDKTFRHFLRHEILILISYCKK
jgi:hypothetical protein